MSDLKVCGGDIEVVGQLLSRGVGRGVGMEEDIKMLEAEVERELEEVRQQVMSATSLI